MIQLGLLLTVLVPLGLAAAIPIRRLRPMVGRLAVAAPLPALGLAAAGGNASIELPWVLFGAQWGLDPIGRVFLGFTASSWLAAGLFARPYFAHESARSRFDLFHLLTMAGNLGVILSEDLGSFLLFFTLTSMASYGLITHHREPASLHAGRIYIVMVIVGELLLFWGILLAAHEVGTFRLDELAVGVAASPLKDFIIGPLLAGFGIKLGLMPFHFWLPLAHPAAPTPSSAVLSGAIIKTGLLGWLRFLPFGLVALPEWGAVCVVAGVATAFLAALLGLPQSNPKTVLAYSSISQMGLVTVGIGAAMLAPDAWATILTTLLLYTTHHAVAKSALFLGVGVATRQFSHPWQRRLVTTGLAATAFSLAGLPLTSGYVAKSALKDTAANTPAAWEAILQALLPATGLATSLLMLRFLWLLWPDRSESPKQLLTPGMVIPWGALSLGGIVLFFCWRWQQIGSSKWFALDAPHLWSALSPILIAGGLTALFIKLLYNQPPLAARLARIQIPAGDLADPLAALTAASLRAGQRWAIAPLRTATTRWHHDTRRHLSETARPHLDRVADLLESDLFAGLSLGLLTLLLLILLTF